MNRICIIATGDRNADWQTWRQVMKNALTSPDLLEKQCVLIHGDARGIDYVAGKVAGMHGWSVIPMPAQWHKDGRPAGPIRNRRMLKMAALMADQGYEVRVYAFHDDIESSKGTKDCVHYAQERFPLFPVTLFRSDGTSERID